MNLQEQISRIQEMMGVISESKRKPIQWVKPDFDTEKNEIYGHFLDWLEDDVIRDEMENFSYRKYDLTDKMIQKVNSMK